MTDIGGWPSDRGGSVSESQSKARVRPTEVRCPLRHSLDSESLPLIEQVPMCRSSTIPTLSLGPSVLGLDPQVLRPREPLLRHSKTPVSDRPCVGWSRDGRRLVDGGNVRGSVYPNTQGTIRGTGEEGSESVRLSVSAFLSGLSNDGGSCVLRQRTTGERRGFHNRDGGPRPGVVKEGGPHT